METIINEDQVEEVIDRIELNPGINYETVVRHMDTDIRESLHDKMHEVGQYLSEIGFLRIYIKAHFDKHGRIFQIN